MLLRKIVTQKQVDLLIYLKENVGYILPDRDNYKIARTL